METAALRLAAVATLLNGGVAPWPTIAGEFVYDSMRDDILDVTPLSRKPIIIVRTDEDQVSFRENTVMGRQCRMLIEASVVTAAQGADGKTKLDWPKTDPAIELMLNIMEWQIWNALRGMGFWADWFQHTMQYSSLLGYSSTPRYALPDRGAVRLAVRTLEFIFKMREECIVPPLHETDPSVPVFLPPTIVAVINQVVQKGGGEFRTAVIGLGKTLLRYGAAEHPRYPALQRVWTDVTNLGVVIDTPLEQSASLEWAPFTVGNTTLGVPDVNL